MRKLLLLLPLLCLPLFSLSGCATLAKIVTPAAQPFLQVAVDVAVATAVGNDASVQKVRAARIKAIAVEVLTLDTGTQVALSAIEAAVNAKIATLNLPPIDLAAAQLLTSTLTAVIQAKLDATPAGAVTATTQVAISDICNDVISAVSAYGV
jgi:hypothetical protein